jgi:hypothetical protein
MPTGVAGMVRKLGGKIARWGRTGPG